MHQRDTTAPFVGHRVVMAAQQTLAHADGRQVQSNPEMTGNAAAPWMGTTLAITQQQIWPDAQGRIGRKDQRGLAKRQETRHIGPAQAVCGHGLVQHRKLGPAQDHQRRPALLAHDAHIHTSHGLDGSMTILSAHGSCQMALENMGLVQ